MAIEAVTTGLAQPAAATLRTDTPSPSEPGGGFSESLHRLIEAANASDAQANRAVWRMLDGSGDVHDAMIALQQADLMLQFTVQVRNKIVQAYQDIMRMPV